MPATMTSGERIDKAFRHEAPDRTPCFEYVLLAPIADMALGRDFPDYMGADPRGWRRFSDEIGWEASVRRYASDKCDIAQKLRHDLIYTVPCPPPRRPSPQQATSSAFSAVSAASVAQPAAPAVPAVASEPPAPPPDDPVEIVKARNEKFRSGRGMAPDINTLFIYEALDDEIRKRGLDLALLAPAYAHGVWTDTDLMMTMVLDPDVAHEHFALATKRSLALIDIFLQMGVKLIGIGGDFAGNRPLISPQAYDEYIMPELRILSDRIHAGGSMAVNASDGDLWPVIDSYLTGSGVDAYLEIDARAGMDLAKLKSRFGERITFLGNMDCGELLSFASPDEIRAETVRCIEDGMTGTPGGHIFCASNAITPSIPAENYMAMVNAYMGYFGLPDIRL